MALITCPECGGQVSDKATFCPKCGYPINSSNDRAVSVCPRCGNAVPPNSKFCGRCGNPVSLETRGAIDNTSAVSDKQEDRNSKSINSLIALSTAASAPQAARPSVRPIPETPQANVARCPICGSTSLSAGTKGFGIGKAAAGAVLLGPVGLLAGGIGMNKTVVTCLNCGHKFQINQ